MKQTHSQLVLTKHFTPYGVLTISCGINISFLNTFNLVPLINNGIFPKQNLK